MKGEKFIPITLKASRVNIDLSQKQMGDRLGVDRGTILRWETGKSAIPTDVFETWSQVTGCPKEQIILPR